MEARRKTLLFLLILPTALKVFFQHTPSNLLRTEKTRYAARDRMQN